MLDTIQHRSLSAVPEASATVGMIHPHRSLPRRFRRLTGTVYSRRWRCFNTTDGVLEATDRNPAKSGHVFDNAPGSAWSQPG